MVVSDHGFEPAPSKQVQTGTHWTRKALNGLILVRGPRIAHREIEGEMTVNDVTPSILAWLGLPVARDMDGEGGSD